MWRWRCRLILFQRNAEVLRRATYKYISVYQNGKKVEIVKRVKKHWQIYVNFKINWKILTISACLRCPTTDDSHEVIHSNKSRNALYKKTNRKFQRNQNDLRYTKQIITMMMRMMVIRISLLNDVIKIMFLILIHYSFRIIIY